MSPGSIHGVCPLTKNCDTTQDWFKIDLKGKKKCDIKMIKYAA